MKTYFRDCRACGGGGCKDCRQTGTETVPCYIPPPGFTMSADEDEFERDREDCPCYEGIKINQGVDQCGHPSNRAAENWCAPDVCPLVRAATTPDAGEG